MGNRTLFSGPGITCADGCWIGTAPLSRLLAEKGITHFTGEDGTPRPFGLYFDDWYLYRVPEGIWGMWKMREQEWDGGDSDEPGMTVAFIALEEALLESATAETADTVARELQRVAGDRGQRHHEALRRYFLDPGAQAPYRMGLLYIQKLAAQGKDGIVPLPRRAQCCSRRLRKFLGETGAVTAEGIRLDTPLTPGQQMALLASHTGNTSLDSLAAEIRFHAVFLKPKLPGIYASALRADMAVLRREFLPGMPYYAERSLWVKRHRRCREKRGETGDS